ncbi:MAG: F0F1 ATP synthase subunit epsilon [Acidobacteriota bacterium]
MSQSRIKIRIITPGKVLFDGEASQVAIPSVDGALGILPGHRPLVIALGSGEVVCQRGNGEDKFPVHGGYADVEKYTVTLYTNQGLEENGMNNDSG